MRIRAQFYGVSCSARVVRHRYGRRMGSGSFAGDGGGAHAVARNLKRDFAERLFNWIFTGSNRGAISSAGMGMAADVLDRRIAGLARAVHQDQSSRVGGVEAASGGLDRRSSAASGRTMAAIPVPGAADDVHDVSFAWNAGSVSGLFAGSAQSLRSRPSEHRDDL